MAATAAVTLIKVVSLIDSSQTQVSTVFSFWHVKNEHSEKVPLSVPQLLWTLQTGNTEQEHATSQKNQYV